MQQVSFRTRLDLADQEEEEDFQHRDNEDRTTNSIPKTATVSVSDEDLLAKSEYQLAILLHTSLADVRQRKSAAVSKYACSSFQLSDWVKETRLSTGVAELDSLLCGGLASNGSDLIEIKGSTGVGKTSLCLTLARSMIQRHGKKVLFIDTCNALNFNVLTNVFNYAPNNPTRDTLLDELRGLSIITSCDIFALLKVLDDLRQREYSYDLLIIDSLSTLLSQIEGKRNVVTTAVLDSISLSLSQLLGNKICNIIVTSNLFAFRNENSKSRFGLPPWFSYIPTNTLSVTDYDNDSLISCTLEATTAISTPCGTSVTVMITDHGIDSPEADML